MLLPAHICQRFGTQALRKWFIHGGFSFPAARHFLYSIAHLEKEDKGFSENHSQIMPCKHLQILSNMV